jgi:hypothetical protein
MHNLMMVHIAAGITNNAWQYPQIPQMLRSFMSTQPHQIGTSTTQFNDLTNLQPVWAARVLMTARTYQPAKVGSHCNMTATFTAND